MAGKESHSESVVAEKSYRFALRVVNAYKHLIAEHREYALSKQFLRSRTSIGANIAEARQAHSRPDFISKLSIALKETVETEYWLSLLRDAEFLTIAQAESLLEDCLELKALLTASIKTLKNKR